jgi:hypothetical protein
LRIEHLFATVTIVEDWELEQLRRAVAMLAPGHSAGALSKRDAERLIAEVGMTKDENARQRNTIAELQRTVADLRRPG